MTERPSGQSKVMQAVSDNRTFYVGLGLIAVWVVFMGFGVFTTTDLAWWAHGPGVLGATLAAPGSLARIAAAWRSAK